MFFVIQCCQLVMCQAKSARELTFGSSQQGIIEWSEHIERLGNGSATFKRNPPRKEGGTYIFGVDILSQNWPCWWLLSKAHDDPCPWMLQEEKKKCLGKKRSIFKFSFTFISYYLSLYLYFYLVLTINIFLKKRYEL